MLSPKTTIERYSRGGTGPWIRQGQKTTTAAAAPAREVRRTGNRAKGYLAGQARSEGETPDYCCEGRDYNMLGKEYSVYFNRGRRAVQSRRAKTTGRCQLFAILTF